MTPQKAAPRWTAPSSITATDCGGNTSTAHHVQTINFFDVEAPSLTLTCPDDTTVASLPDCTADLSPVVARNARASTRQTTVTRMWPIPSISPMTSSPSGALEHAFTRAPFTVTAVDDCGQERLTMCTQDITVEDVTAPIISMVCPDDANIVLDGDCSWSGSSGQPAVVVNDACDPTPSLEVIYVDHDTTLQCLGDDGLAEGSFSFIRTFTATSIDACGNVATQSCDQWVSLWDSAAPSLHELETLPTDTLFLDAACETDLDPAVLPSVSAEDACDSDVAVAISHSDDPAVYEALSDGVALQIDTVAIDGAPGATTYRLYAVLNNPDDCLSAVVGEGADATWITSTAPFYQHELGAATPSSIDPSVV